MRTSPPSRMFDITLAVIAVVFAGSSFTIDALLAFGIPPRPDSEVWFARWWYENYAGSADPLLVANPLFVRIQATFAFAFGLFYLALAYALVRRRDWIRMPAILYSAANIYGLSLIFGVNLFGEYRAKDNVALWLFCTAPYLIYPFVLLYRMWRPRPFSDPTLTS